MKKRLKFECWNCGETYSLLRDLNGWPKIIVECPYCETEAVVDLAPARDAIVHVFQDGEAATWETLNLPEVIPTRRVTPSDACSTSSSD